MLGSLGVPELLIILLIVLIIFGASKLPQLGKGLGQGLRNFKDSVKGVVITSVEAGSAAAEKRLNAGDVIVEVAQEQVANADAVQKRIDTLKREGKKSALLLVANAEGELRFVALSLQ